MNGTPTLMIVDDDTDDVDFFCEAVKKIDETMECVAAHNGVEALEKLRQTSSYLPDLIFLDLNMPLMDGRACLKELKKDNRLQGIPVIIYTTSGQQTDKDEMSALGAEHFITKPTSFLKLCEAIENIVNEYFEHRR